MDPLAGFNSASELATQLITLATGILALSITFVKDVVKNGSVVKWPLKTAWFIYLLSIVLGMWVLMAVTGSIFRVVSNSTSTQSVTNSSQSITNANQSVTSSPSSGPTPTQPATTTPNNSSQSMTNTAQSGSSTQTVKSSSESATYGSNVAIPALLQIVSFLVATVFLICYGAKNI